MIHTARMMLLAFGLLGNAGAQTAAEIVTVTSITSTLASSGSIRLPSGTGFVSNPRYANELAPRLLGREAPNYTDYRLYVARGLARNLAAGFAANVRTSFAASGLFEERTQTVTAGGETWTRSEFSGENGQRAVLLITQRTDGVYMLTAQRR